MSAKYDPDKSGGKRPSTVTTYEIDPDQPLIIKEADVGLGFWGGVLIFIAGAMYGGMKARIVSLEERLGETE